ncbi:hypothetical protein GDO81_013228 [Engystomops pustulosus]|uniref:Uncharacterized protein n=1 Tax=Engystomops pustulosus TaxID=76066 RepID=A0AAV7AXV1_ENGPU|nr:hypothetical protein GDO81_013228 [Engystomops pustulosus]
MSSITLSVGNIIRSIHENYVLYINISCFYGLVVWVKRDLNNNIIYSKCFYTMNFKTHFLLSPKRAKTERSSHKPLGLSHAKKPSIPQAIGTFTCKKTF